MSEHLCGNISRNTVTYNFKVHCTENQAEIWLQWCQDFKGHAVHISVVVSRPSDPDRKRVGCWLYRVRKFMSTKLRTYQISLIFPANENNSLLLIIWQPSSLIGNYAESSPGNCHTNFVSASMTLFPGLPSFCLKTNA